MNVRQYQTASMYEAVQKIKKDLGPDAVILHAKQIQQRRFGLFPAGVVWEVTAAVDSPASRLVAARPTGLTSPAFASTSQSGASDLRQISATLAELQWEVRKLAKQGQFSTAASFSPNLRSLYFRLREQEVDEELAGEVVTAIGDELSSQALQNHDVILDCASRRIQGMIRCSGPLRLQTGVPRTVFIIGPTGVGKTTTIAKLAADLALFARKRVLLVTIDTYRIAALPQLRTYGEIMGVPLEVAYTPSELQKVIADNQDKDLILIDTPGRGQRNEKQIADLKAAVDAVEKKTVYLAVSAATRHKELMDVVDRFGVVGFDSLVITKVDEAVVYGPILNLASRCKKPLSYITTGQNVPEDIEDASGSVIADLVLGRVTDYASGPSCDLKKSG